MGGNWDSVRNYIRASDLEFKNNYLSDYYFHQQNYCLYRKTWTTCTLYTSCILTTGHHCREVHFVFSSMSGNHHPLIGLAQWPFQSHSHSDTPAKHLTSTLHEHQPYRTTYMTMNSFLKQPCSLWLNSLRNVPTTWKEMLEWIGKPYWISRQHLLTGRHSKQLFLGITQILKILNILQPNLTSFLKNIPTVTFHPSLSLQPSIDSSDGLPSFTGIQLSFSTWSPEVIYQQHQTGALQDYLHLPWDC